MVDASDEAAGFTCLPLFICIFSRLELPKARKAATILTQLTRPWCSSNLHMAFELLRESLQCARRDKAELRADGIFPPMQRKGMQ